MLARGDEVIVGVGVEATAGTFVAAQDYVRSREPDSIKPVTEKVTIKETRATGVASEGDVVTMKKVEGDLPLNLRFRTIGYFLKSLLGGLSSSTEAGESAVYRHAFSLSTAAVQPTLSLSHVRGDFNHKQIPGAVVSKLALDFPVDDVINGVVTLKGRSMTTVSDFTPAFATTDDLAPHQMVTLKIAADVSGLGAASAIDITNLKLELDRGSREKLSVSSVSPVGFIAKLLSISGSFTIDKSDDTYQDLAIDNTSKAMQIQIINTAEDIGVGSNPELTFVFPNVTFQTDETRPIDDTITEEVSFTAHYDVTEAKALTVSLLNEKANYNAA